jgi:hypothetical protein
MANLPFPNPRKPSFITIDLFDTWVKYCNAGSQRENHWKSRHADEPLTDQSVPIFFDEVILLEDDLHDNGEVQISVKLRVMPTCVFILSKLFLVDGVLPRQSERAACYRFCHKIFRYNMYENAVEGLHET